MIKPFVLNLLNRLTKFFINKFEEAFNKSSKIDFFVNRNLNCSDPIVDKQNIGLTVSLTTFGQRIEEVFLAIESIGFQSIKAGRVVLWLADDEFTYEELPSTLKRQIKRGLTIEFCEDLKQYKKLIPSLKKYPEDVIITIDDDVIYNFDLVEVLYRNYLKRPDIIFCTAAARILLNSKNKILPYSQWIKNDLLAQEAHVMNFPIGFGGILYFPGCFDDRITDKQYFQRYAPYADDIWFKAMSLSKNIKVASVFHQFGAASQQIAISESQLDSLSRINVVNDMNDIQLKETFDFVGIDMYNRQKDL